MSETVVLVTGANQGLGYEIVKKLAAENENYRIVLGSRNLEKGQQAASEVTQLGKNTKVDAVQIDVNSDDSIGNAARTVEEQYGKVDVLVNNAGVFRTDGTTVREKLHQVFDINAAAIVVVTDAFAPLLRKSKAPRIVIMSSDLGSIGNTLDPKYPFYSFAPIALHYKASKAAVNMIGAVYAVQYKDEGFRVNIVNPGFRQTQLNNYAEGGGKKEDGAIEACRLITLGDAGETGTFSEIEGPIRW